MTEDAEATVKTVLYDKRSESRSAEVSGPVLMLVGLAVELERDYEEMRRRSRRCKHAAAAAAAAAAVAAAAASRLATAAAAASAAANTACGVAGAAAAVAAAAGGGTTAQVRRSRRDIAAKWRIKRRDIECCHAWACPNSYARGALHGRHRRSLTKRNCSNVRSQLHTIRNAHLSQMPPLQRCPCISISISLGVIYFAVDLGLTTTAVAAAMPGTANIAAIASITIIRAIAATASDLHTRGVRLGPHRRALFERDFGDVCIKLHIVPSLPTRGRRRDGTRVSSS